jgi:hypothetical protein
MCILSSDIVPRGVPLGYHCPMAMASSDLGGVCESGDSAVRLLLLEQLLGFMGKCC